MRVNRKGTHNYDFKILPGIFFKNLAREKKHFFKNLMAELGHTAFWIKSSLGLNLYSYSENALAR